MLLQIKIFWLRIRNTQHSCMVDKSHNVKCSIDKWCNLMKNHYISGNCCLDQCNRDCCDPFKMLRETQLLIGFELMLVIFGFNKEGQMSQGQMLTQQMLLWQLSKKDPGKLHLMVGQNMMISNSSDIADIFYVKPIFCYGSLS